MARTLKPRCFVAMAFDQPDTDALYEKSIQPVLNQNSIVPVIINRREDNRDINHQIIEQLEACDFCIADLTYARPSVYFEAGYAQRKADVIYTARSDHVRTSQPDNLRVHFDLQMKPLIRWTKPDDPSFRTRLSARLRNTVLRDWYRKLASQQKLHAQRSEFANTPLAERLHELRLAALKSFVRLGYRSWTPLSWRRRPDKPLSGREMLTYAGTCGSMLSTHLRKKCLHVVSLRIEESLTLKKLREEVGDRLVCGDDPPHLNGRQLIDDRSSVNQTIEHHILASINAVPSNRIMSAMPILGWNAQSGCYATEITWEYEGTRWTQTRYKRLAKEVSIHVRRRINVHFMGRVQCLSEFRASLQSVIEAIRRNQPPPANRRR